MPPAFTLSGSTITTCAAFGSLILILHPCASLCLTLCKNCDRRRDLRYSDRPPPDHSTASRKYERCRMSDEAACTVSHQRQTHREHRESCIHRAGQVRHARREITGVLNAGNEERNG